jgi:deazaflavin-dependent oxidoreductase (nitroreductase family)
MSAFPLPEEVRQLNEMLKQHPEMTEKMGPVHLLSVPGRTSGKLRATPVSPLNFEGGRWLVAGIAEADWVKNLRVAGWGVLTKGNQSERVTVAEVPSEERAPILQAFVRSMQGGRFAFPLGPDEPLAAFATIVDKYPVFRVVDTRPASSIEEAAQAG